MNHTPIIISFYTKDNEYAQWARYVAGPLRV
jgi:hypothetical protein